MLKFVVFDFDGVFTTGKCYFDSNNNIIKYYDIKDGMALSILKNKNILTGLISSYNTSKKILYNDIDESILSHLKFDKLFIGKEKKINILNQWLSELNIDISEVAYIGDDINDIEILEKAGFSACPNNAVQECKDIVKYICKNNGGEGCVREFVEELLKFNPTVIDIIKKEANYQLNVIDFEKISEIAKLIKNKNSYFTGIGKSGNMAFHITSLLKSISINAFYLDPINSTHGDMGTIKEADVVFFFSKSGNTLELLNLILLLKERKCITIGIVCDNNSKFEENCDICLKLPLTGEIPGEIANIPTNSCMSQLFFGNILVSILKEDISIHKYKTNHPAGNIGDKLKKVKEVIIKDFPSLLLKDSLELHNILLEMTKYKMGCCFFTDENQNLIGLLTDGDIRRILLDDENKKVFYKNDLNVDYLWVENMEEFLLNIPYKNKFIPVIQNKKLLGIIRV